jgi:hypothetical protein
MRKFPIPFDPEVVHFVEGIEALRKLKREYPKFADYLFTFKHAVTENIIVGGWTNHSHSHYIEICCLGPMGDKLDMEAWKEARLCMAPTDEEVARLREVEKFSQDLERGHRAARTEQQEEMDDLLDHKRWIFERAAKEPNSPFWRDVRDRRRHGKETLGMIRKAREARKAAQKQKQKESA